MKMFSGAIARANWSLNGIATVALIVIALMSFSGIAINCLPQKSREIQANDKTEADYDSHSEIEQQLNSLMVVQGIEVIKVNLMNAYGLDRRRATQFSIWIYDAHVQTGVPVEHLASLIAVESSFSVNAVSSVGAVGPAQVVPKFWSEYCQGNLLDPKDNILCGARVLSYYRQRCSTWECAFKTYNVGPSNYGNAHFNGAMSRYMAKINRYQELFSGLYHAFSVAAPQGGIEVALR